MSASVAVGNHRNLVFVDRQFNTVQCEHSVVDKAAILKGLDAGYTAVADGAQLAWPLLARLALEFSDAHERFVLIYVIVHWSVCAAQCVSYWYTFRSTWRCTLSDVCVHWLIGAFLADQHHLCFSLG